MKKRISLTTLILSTVLSLVLSSLLLTNSSSAQKGKIQIAEQSQSSVFTGTKIEDVLGAATSPIPCSPDSEILVIQDNVPWATPTDQDPLGANVTELRAQGRKFCVINASEIGKTNLGQFKGIIISAAQTQTYYDNLFPNGSFHPALTAYVQNGGVLLANLTDNASGPGNGGKWQGYKFLGGVTRVLSSTNDNTIAFPNHPVITGAMPCVSGNCGQLVDTENFKDIDGWGLSSHAYFTNLPSGTNVILTQADVTGDSLPEPVIIEFRFGAGKVLATATTTEWRYVGGFGDRPQNRKLLANLIAYQFGIGGTDPGLQNGSITIFPSQSYNETISLELLRC